MENIRCVIAGIPHTLLADIIQKITDNRQGVEVVYRTQNTQGLSKIVKDHDADVVILGENEISLSNSIDELLETSPQIVAIGILNDARRVCICVEGIGANDLVELIKTTAHCFGSKI